SRQGPPGLRWALYEAAQVARRPGSPDRGYYEQAAERLGGNRACLALARKLLKRCYHTLRELGDDALTPPVERPQPGPGSAAARQAAALAASSRRQPTSVQTSWPLDPSFGCAAWQRVPASRPGIPQQPTPPAHGKPSLTQMSPRPAPEDSLPT